MWVYNRLNVPSRRGRCVMLFEDRDGDGFGAAGTGQGYCSLWQIRNSSVRLSRNDGDRNDEDSNVNPCAQEACDGVDNDCDDVTAWDEDWGSEENPIVWCHCRPISE